MREWCSQQAEDLEVQTDTNVITIISTTNDEDIARLRFHPGDGTWTLHQIDPTRPRGFRSFEWAEPSPELEPLLEVITEDPTGVFWG